MVRIFRFFLFGGLIFITSCLSQRKNTRVYYDFSKTQEDIKNVSFDFIKADTFYMPINYGISKLVPIDTDTDVVFFENTVKHNYIVKINLSNKTTDTLKLFGDAARKLIDCHYINDDSIFIIENTTKSFGFHDSAVLQINYAGKIIRNYNFDSSLFITRNNYLSKNQDSAFCIASNYKSWNNFYDGKLFLHIDSYINAFGEKDCKNVPIIGYIDTKADTFATLDIHYPAVNFGQEFFPYEFKYFNSTIDDKANLILSFPYTPEMIVYNINDKTQKKVILKSKLVDTVYSFSNINEVDHNWQFNYPMYDAVYYDKYRKYYYRLLRLPKDYKTARFIVIVADSNFNYIGEGFVPHKDAPILIFTKDNFFTISLDGNKEIFSYYDINFSDGTNQKLITEVKKYKQREEKAVKNKAGYFEEVTGYKPKNYTYTVIFYDNMCGSIRDFIFKHYSANEKDYEQSDTYLFIVTSANPKKITDMLADYNLSPAEHKNIIIDSDMCFVKYNNFQTDYYPRVVKVRKNKVALDRLYVNEIEDLWQDALIDATKEQQKMKK